MKKMVLKPITSKPAEKPTTPVSQTVTIDLEQDFPVGKSHCMIGFAPGQKLRSKYQLDLLDANPETVVTVVIPHYILTLTTSFVRGMFGSSIHMFGLDRFRAKYRFDTEPQLQQMIDADVTEVHHRMNHSERQEALTRKLVEDSEPMG